MQKCLQVLSVLALVFGASAAFAEDHKDKHKHEDSAKKEMSGMDNVWHSIHNECCAKGDKCEGKTKETCDHVKATVMAAMGHCAEMCKKEGMKCEACAKAKDGGPCQACQEMIVKTMAPMVKHQATTKDATHTIKGADGKTETVKCTMLAGPVCKGCVDEMSAAMMKACKDMAGSKKH